MQRHGRHRPRPVLPVPLLVLLTLVPVLVALLGSLAPPGAVERPRGGPFRLVSLGSSADPATFTPEELHALERRFGVHGPQPALAQLFTEGLDELAPLRSHTLERLDGLEPTLRQESRRRGVNPMLMAAILYDKMQHAKPGKDLPIAAHSGLFRDHGPAQLSVDEVVKQGLLKPEASEEEMDAAVTELLDPKLNVRLLAGQLARLQKLLGISLSHRLDVSGHPRDAKIAATLAYLHNGKLDYPARILHYIQDPELHAMVYGNREIPPASLI